MVVAYILAHLDDEYCALPLIWQARREGLRQLFFYLADYRNPALTARRLGETRRFLARQQIPRADIRHLAGYAVDGQVSKAVAPLFARLTAELRGLGVERLVAPAWEGGHMDHDACAFLAARLSQDLGVEARQFTLYNGLGRSGPLLRGGAPLAENGAVQRVRVTSAEWLRWMVSVAAFPSQAYAWSGIWPAMFAGYARRGFGWQRLTAERVLQRPHAGPLFYERMFKVPYAEVRARLDQALPRSADSAERPRGSMAT